MQKTTLALAALTAAAALTTPVRAAHTLGYLFNDAPGTTSAADGGASTNGQPVVQFQTGAGAVDRFGAPGSGVSGAASDRAFDNTGGTARAANLADFEPIDGLTQFTLAGWFKTTGPNSIGGNQILLYNSSNSTNGFQLFGNPNNANNQADATSGGLVLSVDGSRANSDFTYDATQEYVNFAVTYDGTQVGPGTTANPDPNVRFYVGGIDQQITGAGSGNINAQQVNNDTNVLSIGGRVILPGIINGTLNGFDGLLDNVRIWDFVLTPAQLETARLGDGGNAVPEPASLAAIGLGGLALLRRRRA